MNVLLLHAGIADSRMWTAQVEALEAAGHRVLAPDLPGYGQTPLEPGTISYVDHVAGLLDGPTAVVGSSFGGLVALELAVGRPELVERLVLVGSSIGGGNGPRHTQAGFAEEEAALERGDLAAAAAQQARMWLPDDADPAVRELTEAMTLRTYELQLPQEDDVKHVAGAPGGARWANRRADARRRRRGGRGGHRGDRPQARSRDPRSPRRDDRGRRPPAQPRAPGRAQPAAARLPALRTASESAGQAVDGPVAERRGR